MTNIVDIRNRYIEELRRVLPTLQAWWDKMEADEGEVVWKRWPTGLAGHPRVLAIFRKYYLQIDDMNREQSMPEEEPAEKWGIDSMGEEMGFLRPANVLLFDLPSFASDLTDVTEGICFLPIALNEKDEVV
ncbi:hypothetical protein LB579_29650 [Mesorhizobium sp. BR1-1-7]|uniref:hypothetical protein n=1 Tax=Mesorhizobium sp. BR1-1-7 TaxID=2876647 RepID=UPI001CCEF43D|nr:hypothetical protein [Mesorhizobium sp. BR1-1-7]MBZ9921859.1 hypothetical protein [Mesorhizobium sp. BR1-1-7]